MRQKPKVAEPLPDAFQQALRMLIGRCPQCMGRGWILGYTGQVICGGCRGRGERTR
jgi:hypothetical protein